MQTVKFLVKFLMKGFVARELLETEIDRFTGAVRERDGKRKGKELRKGCEDGQDGYQGSREPAGQAGRREGPRHSYSPW